MRTPCKPGFRRQLRVARGSAAPGGFTIMELLTVISIIALLAVLAFPVLGKMRTSAYRTEAASQLRQLGAPLLAYAMENSQTLPQARGHIPYTASMEPDVEISWQQQLDTYIGYTEHSAETDGARELFTLPDHGLLYPRWGRHAFFLGSHAAQADARKNGGAEDEQAFTAVNLTRITRPDMHIIAGEQGVQMFGDDDADKDDYDTNDPAFGGGKLSRKVHLLFADGHVAGFDEFDPRQMTVRYEGTSDAGLGFRYSDPL